VRWNPRFHGSYINFLTPGVVIMLAVFSAGWTGMGFVEDINGGVMDRMLTTPVWRGALNTGTVAYGSFMVAVQTVVIVILSLVLGADFKGGVGGVVLMIVIAGMLGPVFASLSNAVAVLAPSARDGDRGRHLRSAATHLPLGGAHAGQPSPLVDSLGLQVQAGELGGGAARSAAMQEIDWGVVAGRIGLLAALLLVAVALTAGAFAGYQRSL
jgi:ABC-2 type transport system permease protein